MGKITLIKNGYLISMDPSVGDVERGDVLIEDGRITHVGHNLDEKAGGKADVIDAEGKIVMPGLVDNHWHMWQGLIPGVSADDTFGEYFARSLDGLGAAFTPDDTELGVLLSALAGIEAGKTTVVDWNHGALSLQHVAAAIRALDRAGVRAIEAYGPPANAKEWFNSEGLPVADDVRQAAQKYIKPGGLVRLGLAIRGPEFSSMDRVKADVELARELKIPVTMHAGIPGFFQKTNSPKLMEDAGLLGKDITFVHCNAMGMEDFERIGKNGAHVSGSPEVEMQMGFGRSPLGQKLPAGLKATVSVDVPTAIGADLFLQTRILLQRQREQDNTDAFVATGKPLESLPLKDRDVLAFMTINAADSIGLKDEIGSLTPGKQADIIMISASDADTFLRPPAAMLMQAAHPGNITDVFVAGRQLKRNGELTVFSKQELRELHKKAAAANHRLMKK